MSEYASRLDRLRYEEYLYTNLGCIDAILAGRVKTVPNVALDGSPQHLAAQAECQRVDQEIKSAFADRNDYNCSAVPGPDYSCNRRVWSTRESNARMFRTRDRLTAEKAELGIAIRTFFLSRSRR
jgi:hypothetical protein